MERVSRETMLAAAYGAGVSIREDRLGTIYWGQLNQFDVGWEEAVETWEKANPASWDSMS